MKKSIIFSIIFLVLISLFSSLYNSKKPNEFVTAQNNNYDGQLQVYFIDVGQGDCVLAKFKDEYMLIDSGENTEYEKVYQFLNEKKVKKIKYVIATHPHSDHIGSLSYVLNDFEVENIIMPSVTNNTSTFESLVLAIKENNVNTIKALEGENYNFGESNFTILKASNEKYEDLNNNSVVIRLEYKKASFLFTGDIEKEVERDLVNSEIKSTVLKVAHHGSNTSSSKNFLEKVSPSVSIISVGKENSYNHPNKETLNTIKENSDYVFRTDLDGDISIFTDGDKLDVITSK